MDFKLELVLIPVSDVDRAKDFYVEKCGFNLDVDHQPNDEFRVVQITRQAPRARSLSGSGSPTRRQAPTEARTSSSPTSAPRAPSSSGAVST